MKRLKKMKEYGHWPSSGGRDIAAGEAIIRGMREEKLKRKRIVFCEYSKYRIIRY